jgi:hypothetical protein
MLGFYVPYFGSFSDEEFPGLDVAEIIDTRLSLYKLWSSDIYVHLFDQVALERLKNDAGLYYLIKLSQETKESVGEAIAILEKNPLVYYACPNVIVGHAYLDDPASCAVAFNGNGGAPAEQSRSVEEGTAIGAGNMPAVPIRPHYSFAGWNTEQDGSGTAFTEETVITCDTEVYAQWAADLHSVTYKANGGSGADIEDKAAYGSEYALRSELFAAPPGMGFAGWNTEPGGTGAVYMAGSTVGIAGDLELYAQYAAAAGPRGWVIADLNGAPEPASISLKRGATAQFTALYDGEPVSGPLNWKIAETQFASVNSNGFVAANKLFVGQATLMLFDESSNLLASITLRVVS